MTSFHLGHDPSADPCIHVHGASGFSAPMYDGYEDLTGFAMPLRVFRSDSLSPSSIATSVRTTTPSYFCLGSLGGLCISNGLVLFGHCSLSRIVRVCRF